MYKSFEPVVNPHAVLAEMPAELRKAFERYQEGQLQLCVWRNSSPHNWWLSKMGHPDSIDYHWPERTMPGRAFFAFGRKLESTGPRVTYGGFMRGSDEGCPCSDTWVFDAALYEDCLQRWARAVECAKSFNDLAGTRTSDIQALSVAARHAARRLKRFGRGEMSSASGAGLVVSELASRGFAAVTPEGYFVATENLREIRIPRESRLTTAPALKECRMS